MKRERISITPEGDLTGVLTKSKMGIDYLLKIPRADAEKFKAKAYLVKLTPLHASTRAITVVAMMDGSEMIVEDKGDK